MSFCQVVKKRTRSAVLHAKPSQLPVGTFIEHLMCTRGCSTAVQGVFCATPLVPTCVRPCFPLMTTSTVAVLILMAGIVAPAPPTVIDLFTCFVFIPEMEGQSSPLPWKPLIGQQLSFVWCMSVPLLAIKILADFFKIDNLRPKLLISKQAIMNLGEEYLSKLLFTEPRRKKSTLEKQKESWNSIPVWIEASDPGWTGALIYSKLWEAFERAELRLFQFEGTEVATLKNLMS
ncbi:unnamed protein product [Prunus armeniaca]